jgi:hypothetical protein
MFPEWKQNLRKLGMLQLSFPARVPPNIFPTRRKCIETTSQEPSGHSLGPRPSLEDGRLPNVPLKFNWNRDRVNSVDVRVTNVMVKWYGSNCWFSDYHILVLRTKYKQMIFSGTLKQFYWNNKVWQCKMLTVKYTNTRFQLILSKLMPLWLTLRIQKHKRRTVRLSWWHRSGVGEFDHDVFLTNKNQEMQTMN